MGNKRRTPPGSGGGGAEVPNCRSGTGIFILHHPAPPVKPLPAHLQALADLADAEAAKAQGDYATFCRLRHLGLRHQMVWYALIAVLLGGDK